MGPIGVPELIIIFVVALLVFGPRKLPELGKSLGRGLSEFRRASNELRNTLEEEVRVIEQEPSEPIHSKQAEVQPVDQEPTGEGTAESLGIASTVQPEQEVSPGPSETKTSQEFKSPTVSSSELTTESKV